MENLLWEVEFDYDAENNGLISVSVSFHREGSTYQLPLMTGMLTVQCFVRRGWTSEQKAACIVSRLRAALGDVIEITYEDGDDDFKMKVKDNPGDPVRDAIAIAGFSKVDSATGEGITGIKDDPGENGVPLLTGYLLIEGVGDSTEGIAQIQLGKKYPLVEVRTFEKVADQIVKELVEAFNEGYAKLGFVAEPWYFGPMVALDEAAGLSIEKVPCPLGLRAGARDVGLVTEMGLVTIPAKFDSEEDKVQVLEWSSKVPYKAPQLKGKEDTAKTEKQENAGGKERNKNDDPRNTTPPVIYGEEIESPCSPIFVNGINASDCDAKGADIPATCTGVITGFIFPGSRWTGNVDAAVTEINRAFEFYAKYCINLRLNQLNLTKRDLQMLQRWYEDWYRRVVQTVGGEANVGSTSIPTGLNNEFLDAMADLQRLAQRHGAGLLVVFIDEYITDHRPTLVSGVRRNFQQIGINWIDRSSSYILAHELVHAFGKSARNRPGRITWAHNSPCQNAITTIQRTNSRSTIDLSNRFLEVAEFHEIINNRGGNILDCKAGGCKAQV
ncbi:MAG: hypothetical protein AABY74_05220 [Planctomycetota bacterium]